VPTKVLVLTTFDLDEYVFEALQAAPRDSCSRTRPPKNWPQRSEWWPLVSPCWRLR
jgi:DNA-binding NarL/FixJ family response regulator